MDNLYLEQQFSQTREGTVKRETDISTSMASLCSVTVVTRRVLEVPVTSATPSTSYGRSFLTALALGGYSKGEEYAGRCIHQNDLCPVCPDLGGRRGIGGKAYRSPKFNSRQNESLCENHFGKSDVQKC